MSDDTENQDVPSEHTSSSESESDEDPYESEAAFPYELYSADPFYYPYPRTTQIVYEDHCGRKVARLRQPRDLYGVSSTSFFQLPRWPYECQVLKKRIEHIEWIPPVPEPMYRSTGLEQEPAYIDHMESKVIYQVQERCKESYFMCSRVGGNGSPLQSESAHSCEDSDTTLVFESRFESGNLQKVVQVGDYDYQLTLRTDLYTNRHTQWFYFRVKNTRAGVPYRFTIINFMKPTSLYNHGMRPLMYSEIEANGREIGWHRIGDEIKYYKNNFGQEGQSYYSLSWTFRFPHNRDVCYFAHCYPYTYSNLQDYLSGIANDPERSKYCRIRVLCHSLAGNMVYVLTITNPSTDTEESKKKKAVILTARVHPGETNSSWVMKGFLDYILSSQSDAQLLRDTFVFKVVPMLNPDGVIVGNYRCSLSGRDLNRNYKSRLKDSFPSIWFTRNMIKRMMEEREILLYCDLHGHSRKQNVFMYGCKGKDVRSGDSRLCERIFPFMLSKNSPDKFSFSGCKFKVQKNKEGTGRVVMWKMGIRNSYTLEATFCGSTLGKRRGTHFSTKDLESLGYHFCNALLDYCDPEQAKYYVCLKELEEMVQQRASCNDPLTLDCESFYKDVLSDLDSSTGGSDSSDSNGPPAHLMELAGQVKPRKKMLKSKRERNSHRKQTDRNLLQDPLDEDESIREKVGTPILEQELNALTEETVTAYKGSNGSATEKSLWPKWARSDHQNTKLSSLDKSHNLQRVSRRNRITISKQQREPLFQDLDAKKVSVLYLVFNAKGEVITTKSHSYARNQEVMDVTNTLNGFHWNRPLPLLKSLFSQHFPFSSMLEPYCNNIAPAGSIKCKINDSSIPNTASNGCQRESGEKMHRPGNYMQSRNKDQETCMSVPLNRDDHGVSSRITEEMGSLRHVRKVTSLPTVTTSTDAKLYEADELYPTSATKIGQVRNILPKLVVRASTLNFSTNASALPPRKIKGQSIVYSNNGTVQKRKLGRLFCPRAQEVPTIGDNQHSDLSVNTWKDILIGLETDGNTHPPVPAASKDDILKHRTSNGFLNCTRKTGQRSSLEPLPKSSHGPTEFCLNHN
ncbi:cytosolic carboxypeptidase 3 isoform X2 [Mixophyes fleayi]|uniref:cytosolic carboxypeptidase 3 isoform X2 n=1 Tax=Mixophyes fleayi TaxID=3061075 RepID=UPI003F4DDA20